MRTGAACGAHKRDIKNCISNVRHTCCASAFALLAARRADGARVGWRRTAAPVTKRVHAGGAPTSGSMAAAHGVGIYRGASGGSAARAGAALLSCACRAVVQQAKAATARCALRRRPRHDRWRILWKNGRVSARISHQRQRQHAAKSLFISINSLIGMRDGDSGMTCARLQQWPACRALAQNSASAV